MKHLFFICFLFIGGIYSQAQSTSPNEIDTEEMEQKMDEAFSDLQILMDTLDFSKIFDQDLGSLFGDAFPEEFNIMGMDSLDGMKIDEIFGGNISELFGQAMPQDLDMNQLNDLMTESLKMFEQIDMSQLQEMFKGMDFNFEGLEDMIPKDEDGIEVDPKEGEKTKKRKTKKI